MSAGVRPAGCRLATTTRVCDDGRILLTAGRVLRLSPEARTLLGDDRTVHPGAGRADALARRLVDAGAAAPWWPEPPPADETVHDVTVVVPVRDRPVALARLLGRLPGHLPVIVVDDGSDDPATTARICAEHGARLVCHPRSLGPAAARNTGLGEVRTPLVAFCDSDVVPVAGWLGVLRRHLDDQSVAMAAPRVLGLSGRPGAGWVSRYERARSSLDLGAEPASVRPGGRVAYVPSACLLARVEALDAGVGAGFDARLRSGEDVDLVWRLVAAGWRVHYDPAASVRHDHRTRLWPWLARKAFYGTSAAPLARRHGAAVAPLVLSPWSAALSLALLAQRRWSLPVAVGVGAATVVAVGRRLGPTPRRWRTAGALVAEGAVASVWQTGSSLTRHHWPLAALLAVRSRRVRRAWAVAAVVEGVLDHRRVRPDLGRTAYVVVRRLDDLAYGSGLWLGVLRERSPGALLPRLTGGPGAGHPGRPVSAVARGVVRRVVAATTVTGITRIGADPPRTPPRTT